MADHQKYFYVIFAAAAADQVSKLLAAKYLVVFANSGIAFGLFSDLSAFLPVISCTALLLFAYILLRTRCSPTTMYGVALMAGGVIGNLTDRVWMGHVADWIYLPLSKLFFTDGIWFNIADFCLVLGVMLIVIGLFRPEE